MTATAVRELPILFSGEMVRAILEGRNTQTRRVIQHPENPPGPFEVNGFGYWPTVEPLIARWCGPDYPDGPEDVARNPYGAPGDRLWVREAHRLTVCECSETCRVPAHVWYEADQSGYDHVAHNRLRPSIHMPRWASRIELEVTDVRVERVQDIRHAGILSEGVCHPSVGGGELSALLDDFVPVWDRINGHRGFGWDVNPLVWVISFRKVEA